MARCLELALLGGGFAAPNPMVGAVLVHGNTIIGEGYHQRFGAAHAEVNCIRQVPAALRHLIPESTLYVSLEPCNHQGKTPPCTDLILREKIPRVVIGCRDPFPDVNGKGIEQLRNSGVQVTCGILEQECRELNRRFFSAFSLGRPYVVLKWAQSADGFIAAGHGTPVAISNPVTNRLVHRWRSEEASILVGTQTALSDNPALTNRLWTGAQPLRLVIDRNLRVPADFRLLDHSTPTVVFNALKDGDMKTTRYVQLDFEGGTSLFQMLAWLHRQEVRSVLVEGGARLHASFIAAHLWDEARVITATNRLLEEGIRAPGISGTSGVKNCSLLNDRVEYFINESPATLSPA